MNAHKKTARIVGSNNKGGQRILVAYASDSGTTAEVAEAIGEVLCERGNMVETKCVKNVNDLSIYDAVIIGSPILYDRWMPEATEFVTANQDVLSRLPVAYFYTCLALSIRNENAKKKKAMAYSDKVRALVPQVKPVDVEPFAGVLDYSKVSFFIRLLFKAILPILGVQEGDHRDWEAIRSWTESMHSKLADERL